MDEIDLSYPDVIFTHGINDDVCVRLSTAIRIACIDDDGKACSIEYTDSETDPFYETNNVHCYFRIEPTGGVARAVKKMSDSILVSLEKGKLKTIAVDLSLDDSVNLHNTWVAAKDFETWCNERRIDLHESWGRYWEQEQEILAAGLMESDKQRMKCETPNFEEKLQTVTNEFDGVHHKGPHFDTMDMLEELTAYRSFGKPKTKDKPLTTTERKTLLTIIAALAKKANINVNNPGKESVYIEGLTDELGAHVAKRTIEEHLKKIPDALETRMK